jgi:hypothetical protein
MPVAAASAIFGYEAVFGRDWDHDTLTQRLPKFKDLRGFLAK